MKATLPACAATLFLGVPMPLSGVTLFSDSWTPDELFALPSGTFPGRVPTDPAGVNPLVFGAGTVNFEKLIEIPLSPVPAPNPLGPVTFTITASFNFDTGDNDFSLLIGDGTNLAGFGFTDQGIGFSNYFIDTSPGATTLTLDQIFPTSNVQGQTVTTTATIVVANNATDVGGAYNGGSASVPLDPGQTLDLTQPLSLVVLANNNYESYSFNSLSVTMDGTPIPEPSLPFLALGAGSMLLIRRSRRKAG